MPEAWSGPVARPSRCHDGANARSRGRAEASGRRFAAAYASLTEPACGPSQPAATDPTPLVRLASDTAEPPE